MWPRRANRRGGHSRGVVHEHEDHDHPGRGDGEAERSDETVHGSDFPVEPTGKVRTRHVATGHSAASWRGTTVSGPHGDAVGGEAERGVAVLAGRNQHQLTACVGAAI